MKTVKDAFSQFRQALSTVYDPQEIESITILALSELLKLPKAKLKAFPETEIGHLQAENLNSILQRLQTGEPVQYILGHTEFYGLDFKVNPSVLIPRPETEELVEWAISSFQLAVDSWQQPYKILDIGTGSGCIAISLQKNLPGAQVSAMDISTEALKTAKENAELNRVNVNFIHNDILNHSPLTAHYSLIISNPPYVTLDDKKQMHTNVTDFEPHTALFVPEDDPLIFYKTIADFASTHLKKQGLLFFEINENYGQQIVNMLDDKSFKNIELRKDMSNRDRMIKAVLE